MSGHKTTVRIVNQSGTPIGASASSSTVKTLGAGSAQRVATIQMISSGSSIQGYGTAPRTTRVQVTGGKGVAVTSATRNIYGAGGAQHHRTGVTSSAPILGMKRPLEYDFSMNSMRKFHRSTDKSKGLRHFSTKVCEKVKEKGRTNYNEVADELVQEYFESLVTPATDAVAREKQQYDMKNIRRRVYDALNVLMAMNIIEKEKKEIRWVGLPTSSVQECRRLEEEKLKRQERIKQKAEQLQELIIQLVAYKSLVERNREVERNEGRPPQNTLLYLPYIVVNTDKKTMIDCSISHDKTEYLFNFDQPFEIHDDIEVLKRLGMAHGLERAQVTPENMEKIKSYLPSALRDYVDQICEGRLAGGIVGPSVRPQPTGTRTTPAVGSGQRVYAGSSGGPQYITLQPAASSGQVSLPAAHDYATSRSSGSGGAYGNRATTGIRYAVLPNKSEQSAYVGRSSGTTAGGQRYYVIGPPRGNQQQEYRAGTSYATYEDGSLAQQMEEEYSDMDSLGSNSNQGY